MADSLRRLRSDCACIGTKQVVTADGWTTISYFALPEKGGLSPSLSVEMYDVRPSYICIADERISDGSTILNPLRLLSPADSWYVTTKYPSSTGYSCAPFCDHLP